MLRNLNLISKKNISILHFYQNYFTFAKYIFRVTILSFIFYFKLLFLFFTIIFHLYSKIKNYSNLHFYDFFLYIYIYIKR